MKRANPTWRSSAKPESEENLCIYNSFTKQKELFKTLNGKSLKWYSCGPTVYDESHMGHARCYISFDILRRVLQNYFGYDITYCMNITDIDDKIIIKARKSHLLDEYKKKSHPLDKIKNDINEATKLIEQKINEETDQDKKEMYNKMHQKVKETLKKFNSDSNLQNSTELFEGSNSEVLGTWLDKNEGHNITDNSIFQKLPRHFENEFHKDMVSLYVLPATILTRVSEYIPEIIEFTEKIIKNGYAYESNGSVYFNTVKFDNSKDHYYAKLKPDGFGDSKALAEGEGALTETSTEKINITDFALWKNSKTGEPAWDSPWGKGRPGWHIECSAMCGSIFGEQVDIHSGGIDLKFPHHDNEIAQSEAAFCHDNWVNFFLHSGHLHIQGCKMSKSLKNFITIKDALQKYTARQIRLLFLLHTWKDTLDYSDQGMDAALSYEKSCKEFFFKVKDFSRDVKLDNADAFTKVTLNETELLKNFQEKKTAVHKALCDSINTPVALREIINLISIGNTYMINFYNEGHYNHIIMLDIANYISNLFKIFGVIEENGTFGFGSSEKSGSVNLEETIMPYLNVMSKFRDDIRGESRLIKATEILKLCDDLRDNVLPDLGVLIEDLADRTVVKLCDKETLIKEREQKLLMLERKRLEDLKRKEELLQVQREKEAKKSINPAEMFLKETEKYTKFDDKGFPLLDIEDKELPKSQTKKLQKLYDQQKKSYEEYLKKKNSAAAEA